MQLYNTIPVGKSLPINLEAVFDIGSKPVGELVQAFSFDNINILDPDTEDYLHIKLAPSYGLAGQFTKADVKQLPGNVKIMITGALRSLSKLSPKDRNYERIHAALINNMVLKPGPGRKVVRRKEKILRVNQNILLDIDPRGPDVAAILDIQDWLMQLVGDEDVLGSTKIAGEVLQQIVQLAGVFVDALEIPLLIRSDKHEKTLVDITVLRFPDKAQPILKLYRVVIKGWSESSRSLWTASDDKVGISGEYICQQFQPRSDLLECLKNEVRSVAIRDAEGIFQ